MTEGKHPKEGGYLALLRQANAAENKEPQKALDMLQKCENLLHELVKTDGSQKHTLATIQKRIAYLEAKIAQSQMGKVIPPKLEVLEGRIEDEGLKAEGDGRGENGDETIIQGEEQQDGSDEIPVMVKEVSEPSETQEMAALPSISPEFYIPVITPTPLILDVFTKLSESEEPTFEEYMQFYRDVNTLVPVPLPAIVYQEAPIGYFVGDTHGAYAESQAMVAYFEKIIEKSPAVKIIFDGDYVDRNPNDLENVTLIIGFFLKYPSNVLLLRGNHEDAQINAQYGFRQNLLDNLIIEERAEALYEQILTFFTKLSVGHVLELFNTETEEPVRVFTVHAGIPVNTNDPTRPVIVREMELEIQTQSPSFETFDKYMNWLLWADPKEEVEEFLMRPETGRHQFGKAMFDRFMAANGYHFMVRAHEVLKMGYKFFFDQRLVSLFSASRYGNAKVGNAAFLRLEPGKAPTFLPTDRDMLDMDLSYM